MKNDLKFITYEFCYHIPHKDMKIVTFRFNFSPESGWKSRDIGLNKIV